ncbi:DUF1801 domain-containing protein [Paraburkholderia sp. D15]|uniref:DUF1801 domain-containing protein n=1 Tax=Paraburkholderia sp. D15 TaxID=2880218 RepID=UPI00247B071C|nr:DUF1801 domain-containing protein [Paraburkholderia sp. D15]WGS53215.1 DUF1801 domain-containing protein [Paraburkholderia sp. D15]
MKPTAHPAKKTASAGKSSDASADASADVSADVSGDVSADASADASANITRRIEELADWRGATLAHVRQLIHAADPGVQEEWKWMGTPVWSHDGIICTGESYKQAVKLTFARGASLKDPKQLFNASLDGNTRRAIDIHEGEKINESAFKQLIQAAVKANAEALAERAAKKKSKPRA